MTGAPIAIKLRQGKRELALQDETGIVMLTAEGISFGQNTITLNFYWAGVESAGMAAFDITTRHVRNLTAWLQRAEMAYRLDQGEPVDLLIKLGTVRQEARYGRDYIRWQVAGGRIELPQFPQDQGQMLAYRIEFAIPNMQGEGHETACLLAAGGDVRPAGGGGQLGHVAEIAGGGLEITGGVNLLHRRRLFDRLAGTLNLWWEPLVAKQAYGTSDVTAAPVLGQVVYDIRQDIDGGAWWSSEEADATSWADELAGSSLLWPTVSVFEWGADFVRVRDGSNQTALFTFDLGVDDMLYVSATANMRIAAVHVENRRLFVAITSDNNNSNGGLVIVDFQQDRARIIHTATTYEYLGTIAQRNAGAGVSQVGSGGIPDADVYDVRAAYIEGVGQCCAIATGDGVAIWRGLYAWVVFDMATYNDCRHVWLTSAGRLYWVGTNGSTVNNRLYMLQDGAYYVSDQVGTVTKTYLPTTDPALLGANADNILDLYVMPAVGLYDDLQSRERGDVLLVAGDVGVSIIEQKFGDEGNGLVRYLTKDYSTGPMVGNVLGYWIAGAETGATLNDRSRNNNDMTVAGFGGAGSLIAGDWSDTESVRGKALAFGGTDYLTRNALQPASTFLTWGAFFQADSVPGGSFDAYIINEGFAAGQKSYYLKMSDGGTIVAGVSVDGNAFETVTSSITVSVDKWYSAVVMYSGTTLRITVWDEDGNRGNDSASVTGGAIDASTDPLRIGCRADAAADRWSGFLACVFVAKETYAVGYEDFWTHKSGLTAERQVYGDHVLGGSSNQCNAIAATEDGGLILIASGDGGADGKLTYWRYLHDHQDRAAVEVEAAIHKAVATGSGLLVAATETLRAKMAPVQDVYFWDHGQDGDANFAQYDVKADRNTYLRGAYQSYGYWSVADGKVYCKFGATTALASTAALTAWGQGDIIQLTFRYGHGNGVAIFADGVSIGSSATYSGANHLWLEPTVGNVYSWWLGMDYQGRHPIGRVYDVQYWPVELTSEEIAYLERGPGEMPFIWTWSRNRRVSNRHDSLGRCDAIAGNIPGDMPAGVRLTWEGAAGYEALIGVRAHHAAQFLPVREAENYTIVDGGQTTLATDSSRSAGAYLTTTATDTVNTWRASIRIARTALEELLHYGRYRIMALCYETGVTPAHKIQFRYGATGTQYDYATPQTSLPVSGSWVLVDCGEVVFPPVLVTQVQRRIDLEQIEGSGGDNLSFWSGSNFTSFGYFLERPSGCSNDFRLDCVFLLPADYAVGSWRLNALTARTAHQLVSMRGDDFGAMAVGDTDGFDGRNGYEMYRRQNAATWTGDRVFVPVGQYSKIILLTRYPSTDTVPFLHTLTGYSYLFCTVRPYFSWLR